jgi:hypothetical protein
LCPRLFKENMGKVYKRETHLPHFRVYRGSSLHSITPSPVLLVRKESYASGRWFPPLLLSIRFVCTHTIRVERTYTHIENLSTGAAAYLLFQRNALRVFFLFLITLVSLRLLRKLGTQKRLDRIYASNLLKGFSAPVFFLCCCPFWLFNYLKKN